MQKVILCLYCAMFFLVPLVLWPYTSEVFEFNKIVVTYIFTTLIIGTWAIRMIKENKFILRRTMLDIPILIFLGSQLISTFLSIDPSVSIFGYYSRFNGGLLSIIAYSLLYWAYVSNLNSKQALSTIHYSLLTAIFVCFYGILQHFGIDKHIWVQDVQSRVFSTLGQPNWLAAYLVALLPLTFSIYHFPFAKKFPIINYAMSILFFITLLFTKSRSGLLGFIIADLIYWSIVLYQNFKINIKSFAIYHLAFAFLALIIGTQFTPSLSALVNHSISKSIIQKQAGTVLETGGTESGEIRKIVWKGAIDIWKNYPIFGTGPETFAFSYYQFRPLAHNHVSEWDFIYNKAHNEYLNYLASSGILGLSSYLVLILFSMNQFIKVKRYDFLAGYVGLLITNFFGFSVVPTQLQLFLFPAIALVLVDSNQPLAISKNTKKQNILNVTVLLATGYLLIAIFKYWSADYYYNSGKNYNSAGKPNIAINFLTKAVKSQPKQAIYKNELAITYALLGNAQMAEVEIEKAVRLEPNNINIIRSAFGVYIRLSEIDQNYLIKAKEKLDQAILMAPNDPKLYYNLGLMYARTGQNDTARKILEKAIELKPDYADPKKALDLI